LLGYADANSTYGRISLSNVLSVNQAHHPQYFSQSWEKELYSPKIGKGLAGESDAEYL
jgi:hypothetical protein